MNNHGLAPVSRTAYDQIGQQDPSAAVENPLFSSTPACGAKGHFHGGVAWLPDKIQELVA